jgi:hypothetical protein
MKRALPTVAIAAAPVLALLWFSACGDDRERIHPTVTVDSTVGADVKLDSRDGALDAEVFADADASEAIDANETTDIDALDAADAVDADDSGDSDGAACVPMDTSEAEVPEGGAVGGACNCPAVSKVTTAVGDACSVSVTGWADEGHDHVAIDTPVIYCTKPPSSGPHYPFWASFRSYPAPFAYGYLVHSMEHGAVVIFYKCAKASDCPAVAASLQAIIDARPVDPLCIDPDAGGDADPSLPKRRIILMPDPTLDVPIAASAWQWTYRAGCVDATTLNAFLDAHYAKALEDFCSDGIVPP